MPSIPHSYSFDPTYGYTLDQLLAVDAPEPPPGFEDFWRARYDAALAVDPAPALREIPGGTPRWRVAELGYRTTDGQPIRGWALLPREGEVKRGFIWGHGYGGMDGPWFDLPFADAVIFFPCMRGISQSRRPGVAADPLGHVLHGIEDRDRYIHGACVEDLWLAVTSLIQLFPQTAGRIGLLGISFGGGIGMLALPWDDRIARGHFEVPSFGHHPLRLTLPTHGSGAAVAVYEKRKGGAMETLRYHDAATAARFTRQAVHIAAALFDPFVAPPGQFAIYNALPGERKLYLLEAGHHDYPAAARQRAEVLAEVDDFFSGM